MKLKSGFTIALFAVACVFASCGNDNSKSDTTADERPTETPATGAQAEAHGAEIKEGDITMETPLNKEWVSAGKATYELKCQSCHKLTEERLVGPGWKNVTKRRSPVWIMNMITNVDMMLDSDPEAQKLLEQCMVRMPNQNISKDQAREVLEFMRSNDGEK